MKALEELSVFLPAYNEAGNICQTITDVYQTLKSVAKKFEILVIDDGSTDGTATVVKAQQSKFKGLRLIKHKFNRGYGGAIKTGLKSAQYSWVAYLDSDGQFDFKEVKRFLPLTKTADLITGYRLKRSDSWYRRALQRILHLVGRVLFGLNVKDVDCGFKLIKKQVIDQIMPLSTESAITETEILARAQRAGFKIQEAGVNHHSRAKGEQTGGQLKVVWRAAKQGIVLWWQLLNKVEFFSLLAILGVAAGLRFYRLRDYIVFLGDQGRDVLVVKRILIDHQWTLLGPTASVAGFYLGPIYYYFMLPFLWLSGLDPVGPAIMVASVGVATVYLIYLVASQFNRMAGLIAAWLYALSPIIVYYSRSSWNPNLVPFFSLLIIYLLQRAKLSTISFNPKRWFWIGLCLGICFQLHYLTFILLPLVVMASLVFVPVKHWLKMAAYFCLGTLFGFSPFLLFELRHHWPNSRNIFEFMTRKNGSVGFSLNRYFTTLIKNGRRLIEETLWLKNWTLQKLGLLIMAGLVWLSRKKLPRIGIWLVLGLVLMSLYKGAIYDYYFGWAFPLPIILIAIAISWLLSKKWYLKLIGILVLGLVSVNFCQHLYFHDRPSKMVDQTEEIAHFILDKTKGEKFNFALVTGGNSDHAYRYFFEIWGQSPLDLGEEVTSQLLVLCENKDCQILGHPLWEIAGFGRADSVDSWVIGPEFKVFRLVHHPDSVNLIGQPAPQGN